MIPSPVFFLAPFLLGFAGGLRTFVPGAILLLAVCLGYLHLDGTWLAFLSSQIILVLAIVASFGELVVDKLPFAPDRTAWFGLIGRIVSGLSCGAILMTGLAGNSLPAALSGAAFGVVGTLVGTFGGFFARKRITKKSGIADLFIAIPEDLIAIGLSVFAVFLAI